MIQKECRYRMRDAVRAKLRTIKAQKYSFSTYGNAEAIIIYLGVLVSFARSLGCTAVEEVFNEIIISGRINLSLAFLFNDALLFSGGIRM